MARGMKVLRRRNMTKDGRRFWRDSESRFYDSRTKTSTTTSGVSSRSFERNCRSEPRNHPSRGRKKRNRAALLTQEGKKTANPEVLSALLLVVFLQRPHPETFTLEGANPGNGGNSAGNRRNTRYSVVNRSTAYRALIEEGLLPQRRVDQQIHLPALHIVGYVRAAFVHLIDGLHWNAGITKHLRRTPRRNQAEAHRHKVGSDLSDELLVVLIHADESHAALRKHRTGADLRLDIRLAEGVVRAHHFAGGLHLRSEDGVHSREPGEWKHR